MLHHGGISPWQNICIILDILDILQSAAHLTLGSTCSSKSTIGVAGLSVVDFEQISPHRKSGLSSEL